MFFLLFNLTEHQKALDALRDDMAISILNYQSQGLKNMEIVNNLIKKLEKKKFMDPDVDTEKKYSKTKKKAIKKAAESKEQQDLDQLEKEQSNKTATQTEARSSKKAKVTSNRPKVQEPGFMVKSTKVLKKKA